MNLKWFYKLALCLFSSVVLLLGCVPSELDPYVVEMTMEKKNENIYSYGRPYFTGHRTGKFWHFEGCSGDKPRIFVIDCSFLTNNMTFVAESEIIESYARDFLHAKRDTLDITNRDSLTFHVDPKKFLFVTISYKKTAEQLEKEAQWAARAAARARASAERAAILAKKEALRQAKLRRDSMIVADSLKKLNVSDFKEE